ncbi:MAG: methyltransferase family protein [Planctomycetota bacterium]
MGRPLSIRLVLAPLAATAAVGLVLFLPAGRLDLPFFWIYVAVMGATFVVGFFGVDPDLLRERARPGPGGRDYLLIYAGKLLFVAGQVVAALDVGKRHFSDGVPTGVQVAAMVAVAAGMALALWAMLVNPFFSSVIRLQTDRGHELVSAGPYRLVRHPGYTGVLVAALATGPALGSWGAMAPLGLFVVLLLRRAWMEDRFLRAGLDGYAAYADRVRWRLLPGLW